MRFAWLDKAMRRPQAGTIRRWGKNVTRAGQKPGGFRSPFE